MYVGNNPVNWIDPTGHSAISVLGGGIFAGIGVGIAVLTAPVSVPVLVLGGLAGITVWALFGDVVEDLVFNQSYEDDYEDEWEDDYDDTWDDYEEQCRPQKGPKMRPDNSNKQVDQAASEEGLTEEEIYDFRRYVEDTKREVGKCNSDNFSYKDLRKMARQFKDGSR